MQRAAWQQFALAVTAALAFTTSAAAQKATEGKLMLVVTDGDGGKPMPCRVHIKNQAGVPQKLVKMPFWGDHFVTPGEAELVYRKGNYTFTIERGPEYSFQSGYFIMQAFSKDTKTVPLHRAVNMAGENWWSGDLHVVRFERDIEPAMLADDLHVAPLVMWNYRPGGIKANEPVDAHRKDKQVSFDDNRVYDRMCARIAGPAGTLLMFNLEKQLDLPVDAKELTSLDALRAARQQQGAWVDGEKIYAWDLPVWLAAGIDSVEVIHSQFGREKLLGGKLDGRAPPKSSIADVAKSAGEVGEWSQRIYWQLLNCGLRVPPSAGSGTGDSANPLGYNRLYAWVDKGEFSYPNWLGAIRAGRVTVTNGPLLQPLANGEPPGEVFQLGSDGTLEIDMAMNLAVREKVSYMEVIRNGQLAQSIRLDEWAKTGRFPPLRIKEPGWFLVRVVTDTPDNYRFGMTAPWFVETADGHSYISRKSVQFFLDWLADREQKFHVVPEANAFWHALLEKANAE
ncbi:MAG: hypothetical protein JSS27_07455 [Planctomycetes bacterium]|nr:hypothetical protein [Planctomycetota bacterium]